MNNLTDTKSRLKTNGIFLQLTWLLAAAIVTFLLAVFVFKWEIFSSEMMFHFYDTYYVIYSLHVLIPLFLGINFTMFLVISWRKKFTKTFPNVVVLVSGILLVFSLVMLQRFFPGSAGNTTYQSLSATGVDAPAVDKMFADDAIFHLMLGMQLLTILALLHMAFHWGRSKSKPA
jgi:hypothetical protein